MKWNRDESTCDWSCPHWIHIHMTNNLGSSFMVSDKVQTRCPSLPHLLGAWGWLQGPALWPRPKWDPSLTMSLLKDGPTSKLILMTRILHKNYLLYFQCLWIQSVWLISRWLSLREWRRERSSEETAWGMCAWNSVNLYETSCSSLCSVDSKWNVWY